ncbi:DUF2807 domain-containing protein [Gammaproteobacteria bacterium]
MKKILVVTAILIFTVGCHKAPTIKGTIAPEVVIAQKYNLPPFKSIALNGNTTIELVNGSYAARVVGFEKDLYDNRITVTDQVLHVAAPLSANNPIIKVFSPGLKSITVTGNATVNAKDFKTAGLTVTAKGNGTINLEGQYIIDKIYQSGNGRINISWIDSDNLFVSSSSSGPICLSGTVNSMVARLTHRAYFDARYLRVQRASVFTTDRAHADILVLNTLGAFAVDNSNIFYYKKPHHLTIVTNNSGNVLQPGWIH